MTLVVLYENFARWKLFKGILGNVIGLYLSNIFEIHSSLFITVKSIEINFSTLFFNSSGLTVELNDIVELKLKVPTPLAQ